MAVEVDFVAVVVAAVVVGIAIAVVVVFFKSNNHSMPIHGVSVTSSLFQNDRRTMAENCRSTHLL